MISGFGNIERRTELRRERISDRARNKFVITRSETFEIYGLESLREIKRRLENSIQTYERTIEDLRAKMKIVQEELNKVNEMIKQCECEEDEGGVVGGV